MSAENAEAKFRRDALGVMSNHAEVVNLRLDRTESAVAALTKAIQLQSDNIGQMGNRIDGLISATERVERGISAMVEEGLSQRETVNNLIRLCTALVEMKAS